ncbi:hypothetical protein RR46_09554 [Papilio xuthus]|uniref:Uncharacterized protein n=1 Tax=Papilio xuthus TaxID=66420 RepID=A0A194PZ70_PAPXU|nr:hypothetical protein RR46_09554 [Papilio xuthus]
MISLKCVVLILVYSSVVFCDECVSYNFEEDFEDLFTSNEGVCTDMRTWNIGDYRSLAIDSPHPSSSQCILPSDQLSCVSSFRFTMTSGGRVEANVYMVSFSPVDQVSFVVNEIVPGGNDAAVGTIVLSSMDPNFVNGWHVLRVTLTGRGTYNAFITFLGLSGPFSTVLIDSFRYIPPLVDPEECTIYENVTTTTQGTETTITLENTESTTEEITSTTLTEVTNTDQSTTSVLDTESTMETNFDMTSSTPIVETDGTTTFITEESTEESTFDPTDITVSQSIFDTESTTLTWTFPDSTTTEIVTDVESTTTDLSTTESTIPTELTTSQSVLDTDSTTETSIFSDSTSDMFTDVESTTPDVLTTESTIQSELTTSQSVLDTDSTTATSIFSDSTTSYTVTDVESTTPEL